MTPLRNHWLSKPTLRGLSLCAVAAGLALTVRGDAQTARPPVVRKTVLANGLKLLTKTNDASEIVSVVCLVRAGLPNETDEQAGLSALTAEALVRGSELRTPQQFGAALANAGGTFQVSSGFDFTEIAIVTSRERWEQALKLLAEVMSRPAFTAADVDAVRASMIRRQGSLNDDFTGASYQALRGELYRRMPYGRPVYGYAATLKKLTRDDVVRYWKERYVQPNIAVGIVGDIDAAEATRIAQTMFGGLPFKAGTLPASRFTEPLAAPRVIALNKEGPAAQIMVGFPVPPTTKTNYPVISVLDAIVGGGKRARLFANLREKHGIGYELGSYYQPLFHQSHLVAYVATPTTLPNPANGQPEKVDLDKIKSLMLEQLRLLAEKGPTDVELARAKAYVVGRYAVSHERTRDQARWLAWNELMGLGSEFDRDYAARIQAVTKEQVTGTAKDVLKNYALVVTVPPEAAE